MYPNPIIQWLLSPLHRWHLASPAHKLTALAAGAGVAYYTHTRKEWEPWKVAVAGVGAAYGTSLILHTVSSGALVQMLGAGAMPMQPMMQQPVQQPAMPGPQPAGLPQGNQNAMGGVIDMRTRRPVPQPRPVQPAQPAQPAQPPMQAQAR